jgi:hypothetical protein
VPRSSPARALLDALCSKSGRVPELLAALGVRDAVILRAAPEMFVDLTFRVLGSDVVDDLIDFASGLDDHAPIERTNFTALFKKYGIAAKDDKKLEVAVDTFLENASESLDRLEDEQGGKQMEPPRHTADVSAEDLERSEAVALREVAVGEADDVLSKVPANKKATTKKHKGKSR